MAHKFRAPLLNIFYQDLTNAAHVSPRFRWKWLPPKNVEKEVNWYAIGNIRSCFLRNHHHIVLESAPRLHDNRRQLVPSAAH